MEDHSPAWMQDALEAAQLNATRSHILYSQSRLTYIYPVVSAAALCALLWEVSGHAVLLTWLTLVTALTVVRFRMLRAMQPDRGLNAFALSALISGLLWGAAPLCIVPRATGQLVEFTLWNGLVILVVCGLVAGATVVYAASLRVLFCYIVPALLLPGVYLISIGDRYNSVMGLFVLLFLLHVGTAAVRMHVQLRRYFEWEYELHRLRRDLDSGAEVDVTVPGGRAG